MTEESVELLNWHVCVCVSVCVCACACARACVCVCVYDSLSIVSMVTRTANRDGAPQASYDKRRHRNCFQTQPLQAFRKNKHPLRSELMRSNSCTRVDLQLHQSSSSVSRISIQKEPFPRSEFTPGFIWALDADRSPNAAESPRSSRARAPDRLITMVKLKNKSWKILSKNEKKTWTSLEICEKNWWICYRLRMRGCLC